MKTFLPLLLTLIFAVSAPAQDQQTAEQIKRASDDAKRMGVKSPDVPALPQDNVKQDAEKALSPQPSAQSSASVPAKVDVPAGTAKGSITFDGTTSDLKFASAFVDQKDDRKPVILLLSDQKLPTDKWSSEFDMMRDHTKWSGIAVFLDKDGTVFRTDVHTKGQQASVSGMFDVKLNDPTGKDLAGVARSEPDSTDKKLDVTFHAVRK
jgi:hypothetical protein